MAASDEYELSLGTQTTTRLDAAGRHALRLAVVTHAPYARGGSLDMALLARSPRVREVLWRLPGLPPLLDLLRDAAPDLVDVVVGGGGNSGGGNSVRVLPRNPRGAGDVARAEALAAGEPPELAELVGHGIHATAEEEARRREVPWRDRDPLANDVEDALLAAGMRTMLTRLVPRRYTLLTRIGEHPEVGALQSFYRRRSCTLVQYIELVASDLVELRLLRNAYGESGAMVIRARSPHDTAVAAPEVNDNVNVNVHAHPTPTPVLPLDADAEATGTPVPVLPLDPAPVAGFSVLPLDAASAPPGTTRRLVVGTAAVAAE